METGDQEVSNFPFTRVESLCMRCHDNGTTTFLLTAIPHFREILVSSFHCQHCGHKDTGVQFGGSIQPKGLRVTCKIKNGDDLRRQVVKSDFGTIIVRDIDLEIPPETRKGTLSTIEGFLQNTYDDLNQLQPVRRIQVPEQAEQIDLFLKKVKALLEVEHPFEFVIDDPSGNSHVENPIAPLKDEQLKYEHYVRTEEQNVMVGLTTEKNISDDSQHNEEWEKLKLDPRDRKDEVKYHSEWFKGEDDGSIVNRPLSTANLEDVVAFRSNCQACTKEGEDRMMKVDIPYFKEVVLMSFSCEHCGFKTNEIKSGGAISEKGKKIEFRVKNKEDLSRDLLKSDTSALEIPEIGLVVSEGSLGGRFTTVEGILVLIRDELKNNPFMVGDASHPVNKDKWSRFLQDMRDVIDVKKEFTLVIDDPLANSYIQSYTSPDPDPQITETFYKRTLEQDDELGLLAMNTKDFETVDEKEN